MNLLRVFEALMQCRNVTRAADQLGLSQPAVSAALSRLRGHIGDPLFIRVGNGMVPTPRADSLAEPVTRALKQLEGALTETASFDPAESRDTFTLRGADFFSMRLMPSLSAQLAREAPGAALRFLDSGRGDLLSMLDQGEIDLALEQPMETPPWVSRELLFPSPFVVIAAQDNPDIRARGVTPGTVLPMDLFCDLPHAMRSVDGSMSGMTDAALQAVGRHRRVTLVLPHFEAIMLAVAQSRLLSVVPVQLAEELADRLGVTVFEAPFDIPVPQMQLYWHARNDNLASNLWLRGVVLAEVRRLWGG
ncbi:LysR family transcriptional regulator [Actibacterium sp. XHP0104]|uniref:LysR family transcriptional regulator n=1 Tax=Actibacterium sp. XHP0104 TaxID=2984335 RepID=UPI0021E70FF1|nr:LysR family transcriptional regulator [Actibacterium sp. XHP0104]MCV2881778.1 LysR family transcriptional regulator [Actibacterium sp. XHP0104]